MTPCASSVSSSRSTASHKAYGTGHGRQNFGRALYFSSNFAAIPFMLPNSSLNTDVYLEISFCSFSYAWRCLIAHQLSFKSANQSQPIRLRHLPSLLIPTIYAAAPDTSPQQEVTPVRRHSQLYMSIVEHQWVPAST